MRKILTTNVIALALSTTSAFSADLPSHKAPQPAAPVLSWTGAYAGLNAGYNWGTNANLGVQNQGPAWTEVGESDGFSASSGPVATSGWGQNTQSGFIGGAQFGYNYQWSSNIVIGIETDIQGTIISGNTKTRGVAAFSQPSDEVAGRSADSSAIGGSNINSGLDYLGTVRGRLGYLVTPTMLIYGTGGFTYGGAYANVKQSAVETLGYNPVAFLPEQYTNQAWMGGGQQNQILTGWNAGGGVEWMFMPNWSLKAEALYWDLGRMNINTASYVTSPYPNYYNSNIAWGRTSVSYQGIQAKIGVSYHFNFANVAPVVAKF